MLRRKRNMVFRVPVLSKHHGIKQRCNLIDDRDDLTCGRHRKRPRLQKIILYVNNNQGLILLHLTCPVVHKSFYDTLNRKALGPEGVLTDFQISKINSVLLQR